MRNRLRLFAGIAAPTLVVAACSSDEEGSTTTLAATPTTVATALDIVDTAVEAGSFTTLVTAVQAAGLEHTLRGEGPFTVLAPTDAAFAALPEGTIEALLADIPALRDILLYHVVPGSLSAEQVVGLASATTAQGSDVTISVDGSAVTVAGANVVTTDIQTSNGIIHVIDAVLLP